MPLAENELSCYTLVVARHMRGRHHFIHSMLTKRKKEKVIKETAVHAKDTGSPEVQVALLTKQIEELTVHLKKHLKDKHSRRGLLQMVADRRRHMKYLEGSDKRRYAALLKKLNLKK